MESDMEAAPKSNGLLCLDEATERSGFGETANEMISGQEEVLYPFMQCIEAQH